jgi:hypothetical protein
MFIAVMGATTYWFSVAIFLIGTSDLVTARLHPSIENNKTIKNEK